MIKNYTSTVPANRSVNNIENKLVAFGAMNILKLYTDKKLSGLCFILPVGNKEIPFKLPSRIDRVEITLKNLIKRPRPGTLEKISKQAERTAWKILSDWVDIQISLIELQQVDFLEVFLPYVYDPNKETTFYEKIKANNFKQLSYSENK